MISRHTLFSTILLFGILCIICSGSTARAGEPEFAVDSYIPEYFHDFEWRVNGGMTLNGDVTEQDRTIRIVNEGDDKYGGSVDRQSMNVSSFLRYRYETIPRFLTVSVTTQAAYGHDNVTNSNLLDDPGNLTRFDNGHANQYSYQFALNPSVDVGTYMYSDLFLSVSSDLQYATSGVISGKSSYHYRRSDAIGIDSLAVFADDRTSDYVSDKKIYRANIAVMPGWGRIYEGIFAATAMYMVDELRREGRLDRDPTSEEMRDLCDLIYYYRLEHPVDKRLLKIEALQHIMNFFNEHGIIGNPGPHGYLLIQDVWDYFPHQSRLFGFRLRGGPGIDYYSSRSNSSTGDDRNTVSYRIFPSGTDTLYAEQYQRVRSNPSKYEYRYTYLTATAEYHKPLDIRWQFDGTVSVFYYPNAYRFSNSFYRYYYQDSPNSEGMNDKYIVYNAMYDINADGRIQYILNSRTSSTFSVQYHRSHYNSSVQNTYTSIMDSVVVDPIGRDDREIDLAVLSGGLTYRLSIPTTLTVQAEYDINSQNVYNPAMDDLHGHDYRLSATLSHYLY